MSAGEAALHTFPVRALCAAVATGAPVAVAPAKISTVTAVVSVAVPWNAGVVTFVGLATFSRLTTGEVVSTTNGTSSLLPEPLPMVLSWVA